MPNPIISLGEMIQVTRTEPGTYDQTNGHWKPGAETVLEIKATILPLNASELMSEVTPAGIETRNAIAIYSEERLVESNEKTRQAADHISWDNREFVVLSVSHRYQLPSLKHYKSIAYLAGS